LGESLVAPGRRYTDAAFSVAGLPRGILRQADLSGSGFAGVRFSGRHRYLDCRFAGADLSAIQLDPQPRPHQFVRCDFTGAQFDGSRLGFALFHECDLSGTRWSGARLDRVRFSECVLDGAVWDGADFVETRIAGMKQPPARPPLQNETEPVAEAPAGAEPVAPQLPPSAPGLTPQAAVPPGPPR
jgi:uncharacterized protein YjbI with pentapeptide repeats